MLLSRQQVNKTTGAAQPICELIYRLYTIVEYIGYLYRRHMPLLIRTHNNIAHLYLTDRLNTTISHTHRCSWM